MWEILGMFAAVHVDITTAFDRRGYTKGDFERSRGNPYVFVDGRLPGKYATSSGHCGIRILRSFVSMFHMLLTG